MQALLDQQARIAATPFYPGTLVTQAEPPRESNRPSIYVFVAAGLFLGLLLGSIAALITSRVRNAPGHSYRRQVEETFDEDEAAEPQQPTDPASVVLDDDDTLVEPDSGRLVASGPIAASRRRPKRRR